MIKPFVAKAFLLLVACSSGLMINAALAASSIPSPIISTVSNGLAGSATLTALAGHRRTGKTSAARKKLVARKGKDMRKAIAVHRRKERRLSGKMAAAIRRTKETEERKSAAIVHRMTGKAPAAGSAPVATGGANASLADAEIPRTNEGTRHFENNKGHLPWPVDSKTILIPFGRYKYMPGVIANNRGVTIAAEEGDDVRAVADGKVQEVFTDLDAVMINHGTYFTTYSNLSAITVCKGDEIKAGQAIGLVGADGQLDFWLSDAKDQMLDPEKWLRR